MRIEQSKIQSEIQKAMNDLQNTEFFKDQKMKQEAALKNFCKAFQQYRNSDEHQKMIENFRRLGALRRNNN